MVCEVHEFHFVRRGSKVGQAGVITTFIQIRIVFVGVLLVKAFVIAIAVLPDPFIAADVEHQVGVFCIALGAVILGRRGFETERYVKLIVVELYACNIAGFRLIRQFRSPDRILFELLRNIELIIAVRLEQGNNDTPPVFGVIHGVCEALLLGLLGLLREQMSAKNTDKKYG